ncbi:hypothetical protein BDA99DRAFT_526576 [Phascolomyces articulosus]|uniref:Uncharacterized protein n=1 Tax=Phascolomyces articulosus TaxID=60185 RepID=A0AAD5JNA6_9FUNG|nr:hypothetical protein BDA99DRAFT_526576 [Phascolomyces articulosus]
MNFGGNWFPDLSAGLLFLSFLILLIFFVRVFDVINRWWLASIPLNRCCYLFSTLLVTFRVHVNDKIF